MPYTNREKNAFLASYMPMMDLSKTEKVERRVLKTGVNLLASGITQVGITKVKADQTYNCKEVSERVPDHRANILAIIDASKGQEELKTELAKYLIKWGKREFYDKSATK
jgi:hypothetical protein